MLDDKRLAEIRERADIVSLNVECHPNTAEYLAEFDVPELIAEVERLKDANEQLEDALAMTIRGRDDAESEEVLLRAENARLARELEAAKGDIPRTCGTCRLRRGWETCIVASFISDGEECLGWQWRGAPSPGEGERGGGEG